jgi:hypothetical protein
VFWFVGFGWWLQQSEQESAWTKSGYEICGADFDEKREALRGDGLLDQSDRLFAELNYCEARAMARYREVVTPFSDIVVIDAFSLGALWLVAWITVVVGRWVATGFRQQT